MLESGWPLEEPPPLQSLVTLRSFQGLTAPERARLLLRSSAETVVEDVKAWKRLAVTGEVEDWNWDMRSLILQMGIGSSHVLTSKQLVGQEVNLAMRCDLFVWVSPVSPSSEDFAVKRFAAKGGTRLEPTSVDVHAFRLVDLLVPIPRRRVCFEGALFGLIQKRTP